MIAALPATTDVIVLVMVTEMAGPVTLKLYRRGADGRSIVGGSGQGSGRSVGYAAGRGSAQRVPQAGEQALPPAASVQVTPELVESFWTLGSA